MDRNAIIERIRAHAPAIRQKGATGLFIFGSRARGDAREDSDLDVFVDYDPSLRFSLLQLIGIEQLLENALGLRVDVTTRNGLDDRLRPAIERNAIRVL